ncbi:MAG: hypothetical protein FWD81_03860 [Methanomassiliicoccaceae archaeon]|nr:hypothetical protein [Methanomassiliicoccaceae archaeon]
MGNADSSGTSRGKGVLGGLLRRVSGDRPEREETAPATGVSLRDRFSALEPVAVPTEAVPKKVSENVPDPDAAKDVKVVHTSAARSIRFSDRIGLAVASETDDTFERRISFDEYEEEAELEIPLEAETTFEREDVRIPDSCDIEEDDIEEYDAVDAVHDTSDDIVRIEDIVTEAEDDIQEEVMPVCEEAPAIKEAIPEQVKLVETAPKAVNDAVPEAKEQAKPISETVPVTKETVPEQTRTKAVDHDFDEGYDFLPRRNVSNRFAAMNDTVPAPAREAPARAPVREAPVRAPVKETPQAEKKSTLLAERMKARHTDAQPKKWSEAQADGPVQHESASRTSLLEKVSKERTSAKSISEIIRDSQPIAEPKGEEVSLHEEIEEYEAEISVSEEPAVRDNVSAKLADMRHRAAIEEAIAKNAMEETDVADADIEADDDRMIMDVAIGGETLDAVVDVEQVDMTEAIDAVIVEVVEPIGTIEAADIEETVCTDEPMIEVMAADTEAVDAEVPDIEIMNAEMVEDVCRYDPLKEIENDAIVHEETDDETYIDTAEAEASSVSEGVIVDGKVIPVADTVIEVHCTVMPAEEPAAEMVQEMVQETIPESVIEAPATVPEAVPTTALMLAETTAVMLAEMIAESAPAGATAILEPIPEPVLMSEASVPRSEPMTQTEDVAVGDAFRVCFAFASEENPSPSTSVNFVWG